MARYLSKRHNGKKVWVHRQLMEEHLGRKLGKGEVVRHLNGDKKDNRIENLKVFQNSSGEARLAIKKNSTKICYWRNKLSKILGRPISNELAVFYSLTSRIPHRRRKA